MIKSSAQLYCLKVLSLLLMFTSLHNVFGQHNTSSPYSMFGLGVLESAGNAVTAGSGNAGIAMPSNGYLNSLNPASYSALDSLSFYFNLQARGTSNRFSTSTQSQTRFDSNFDAVAMGFKIKPYWGFSMGLYPFSSVGYEITENKDILGYGQKYPVWHTGEGGLSKFAMGNSFRLFKGFSVGLNLSFLWGSMDVIETSSYASLGGETIVNTKKWYYNNFFLEYGVRYQHPLKNGNFYAGLVFNPESNVYATFNQTIESTNGSTFYYEDESADDVFIPQTLGLGLGRDWEKGFSLSADFRYSNWSSLDDSKTLRGDLVDNHTYRMGLAYSPSRNKHQFFNSMSYRGGLFYSDGYLEIRGKRVEERGFTLGFSIPSRALDRTINIAWEYKISGTESNGLIQENYHNFKIGFSGIERWFGKPKFK